MRLKGNPHYDDNYTVENGRLINNAPPLEMGITKMAKMNTAKKRAEKISMMVEAKEISRFREGM